MSDKIAALTLKYINYFGDQVEHHIPAYATIRECEWWKVWFVQMLENDHATAIEAVCKVMS